MASTPPRGANVLALFDPLGSTTDAQRHYTPVVVSPILSPSKSPMISPSLAPLSGADMPPIVLGYGSSAVGSPPRTSGAGVDLAELESEAAKTASA